MAACIPFEILTLRATNVVVLDATVGSLLCVRCPNCIFGVARGQCVIISVLYAAVGLLHCGPYSIRILVLCAANSLSYMRRSLRCVFITALRF